MRVDLDDDHDDIDAPAEEVSSYHVSGEEACSPSESESEDVEPDTEDTVYESTSPVFTESTYTHHNVEEYFGDVCIH